MFKSQIPLGILLALTGRRRLGGHARPRGRVDDGNLSLLGVLPAATAPQVTQNKIVKTFKFGSEFRGFEIYLNGAEC